MDRYCEYNFFVYVRFICLPHAFKIYEKIYMILMLIIFQLIYHQKNPHESNYWTLKMNEYFFFIKMIDVLLMLMIILSR